MQQWQKDGIAKLRRSGYLHQFSEMARRMCEPFCGVNSNPASRQQYAETELSA